MKMKRQNVLPDFSTKKPRSKSSSKDRSRLLLPTESETADMDEFLVTAIPDCWSLKQVEEFKKKYDGLVVCSKKLGCNYCAQVESINMKWTHISTEWANCSVEASGKDRTVQQASLRKKMNKHFSSQAHQICKERCKDREEGLNNNCVDGINQKHISTMCRIFNTVYSMAKRRRPFVDIECEIEVQAKNGLDMGAGPHTRNTADRIADHIAREIKKQIFTKIIESDLKLCIIVDEVLVISSKAVLIMFVKVEDSDISPTIFLDMFELEARDAATIYTTVLASLHAVGFDVGYLKKNLVTFCSDGASVMLGRKSGLSARLIQDFPNIVIWHCLNHRLQLILDDSIAEINQVNHFKIFIDKIRQIFHQSSKAQTEIFNISEELGVEIMDIGTVLGSRWAACSLESTLAVWHAYPALYNYFSSKEKYSGMASRLRNKFFLDDLALMIDVLQEISLLSSALQDGNLTIVRADKLIKRSIFAFEMLKGDQGTFERKIYETKHSEAFKNIHFAESKIYGNLDRENLLDEIIRQMKSRLMNCDHLKTRKGAKNNDSRIHDLFHILEPDSWNIDDVHWKATEDVLNVIAVSSAEVERAFSTLNIIYSDTRNHLTVDNVANLLTIDLIGLPFDSWDPTPSVHTWLTNNHMADESTIREETKINDNVNQVAIWKYLQAN